MRGRFVGNSEHTVQVFRGGNIFDGLRYRAQVAVAVKNGRIIAVGEDADVREFAGDGAEDIDLAGALLCPGFQDSHMHPMLGGLERLRCQLTELNSRAEYLNAIGDFATQHPNMDWIRGGGWAIGEYLDGGPLASDLDAVVPDRPVFLPSTDHHTAWVNSVALQISGVNEYTSDPHDGWIDRDASGKPSGVLHEGAIDLVWSHLTTSRSDYCLALLEAQRFVHSRGIIGWHDALIGGYAGLDDPTQAYLDVIAAGALTAQVRASQWWDRHRGLEQLDDLVRRREELREAGLDAGTIKFMMDGIAETFTAAVTEPYLGDAGCPFGHRGLAFMSTEELKVAVQAADAAGFQTHFHAIGDRAVHDALDAIEHARVLNGMSDNRHHIAHLQLVRPDDISRFADLQVAANIQGLWAKADEAAVTLTQPYLDVERYGWQYPFADLASVGTRLAGGSDWPVNDPDPISAIHVAVNRRGHQADEVKFEPLLPEQALTLEQAFTAYTAGSAYVDRREIETGGIRVGMRADLAILDRDPFCGAAEEIGASQVSATYIGGEQVFER